MRVESVDRSSVGFTQNGPNKLGHACVVLLRVPFGHSQSFTCVLRSGSIVNNAVAVVVSQSVSLSRGRISPASFFKRSIRFLIPPEFVRLRRERYASLPLSIPPILFSLFMLWGLFHCLRRQRKRKRLIYCPPGRRDQQVILE